MNNLLFRKFISQNSVEKSSSHILDNMKNCKELLAQELKILYPDFTDIELKNMTDNLIDFYTTAVKVVLNDKKTNSEEFDIDDKNFSA